MDENQRAAESDKMRADRSITKPVDLQIDLAVQRTELALIRTQLAWVRTAFTFITAGLAIDKGAEALHEARLLAGKNWVTGSHAVGNTLTAASTLFLLVASVLFLKQARALAQIRGAKPPWFPPALLISLFVVFLGGTLSFFMLTWS